MVGLQEIFLLNNENVRNKPPTWLLYSQVHVRLQLRHEFPNVPRATNQAASLADARDVPECAKGFCLIGSNPIYAVNGL